VAAPDFLASDLTALLSGKTGTAASGRSRPRRASRHHLAHGLGERTALRAPCTTRSTCPKVAAVGPLARGRSPKRPRPLTLASRPSSGSPGRPSARSGRPAPVQGGKVPDKPGMLMVGTSDHVVGAGTIASAYRAMVIPKRLITLTGAGHLVFADICQLAPGQGGLLAAAPPHPPERACVPRAAGQRWLLGAGHPGHRRVARRPPGGHRPAALGLRFSTRPRRASPGWLGRSQVASRSTSRRAEMTQGRSMTGGCERDAACRLPGGRHRGRRGHAVERLSAR